jgi:predicted peroxiredoxin
MGSNGKVVINLATGLEDPERVTVAFLVGGAAAKQGKEVVMFMTKDAVKLAIGGTAEGVACEGCPPLERLFADYAADGGGLFVCPICFAARKLDADQLVDNATVVGATPLWEWIGDGATVFSY